MRAKLFVVGVVAAVTTAALAGACGGRNLAETTDGFTAGTSADSGSTGGRPQVLPKTGGSDPGSGATGTGGQGTSCGFPTTACGGTCVDVSTDESNCGSCYFTCGYGESCVGGVCRNETEECQPNETRCNNWGCIDLSSNVFACGDCYSSCGNGERCIGGVCEYGTCINGGTFCEAGPDGYSSCVTDFSSDWAHCGACGNTCGNYEYCENGECGEPSCNEYCYGIDAGDCNYQYCEQSGCTDLANDITNCGGCEQSCLGSSSIFSWDAHACSAGTCSCSALATPCGPSCAIRFSYCPPAGYAGSELELCNTLARNAYDRCGCESCLDEVRACSESAACINAMDCTLYSPCVGCSEPFYSCYDQYGEATDPLADALVACLNQNCANP